jgi:4-carboxymuconolactone decarboxylase
MTDQKLPRMRTLALEQMDAQQRRIYDEIAAGPRGGVPGPLAVWIQSPGLADTAQRLGQFVRYESALPPRLSELAILVTGRCWEAEYEWWVHRPIAEEAGLDTSVIDAILNRQTPEFSQADERVIYEFATELHRGRRVSDATYAEALELLGDRGVVDLVGICGYYTLIAMTLNVFEVPLPEGEACVFSR